MIEISYLSLLTKLCDRNIVWKQISQDVQCTKKEKKMKNLDELTKSHASYIKEQKQFVKRI